MNFDGDTYNWNFMSGKYEMQMIAAIANNVSNEDFQ